MELLPLWHEKWKALCLGKGLVGKVGKDHWRSSHPTSLLRQLPYSTWPRIMPSLLQQNHSIPTSNPHPLAKVLKASSLCAVEGQKAPVCCRRTMSALMKCETLLFQHLWHCWDTSPVYWWVMENSGAVPTRKGSPGAEWGSPGNGWILFMSHLLLHSRGPVRSSITRTKDLSHRVEHSLCTGMWREDQGWKMIPVISPHRNSLCFQTAFAIHLYLC